MVDDEQTEISTWLIAAKWMPPRHHVSLIERPRLLEVLNQGLEQKLCLLTAPAGFGKTTLLSQWRQQLLADNKQVAWLTLDEADADINSLLCYLISSLLSAGVELGRLSMLAEQGLADTSTRVCMALLLDCLTKNSQHTVLMLDDYHRLSSPLVDSFVAELLKNAPDNFQLLINSRERPGFDVSQLRSQGQLLEFSPESLRFTSSELQQVMGPELSEPQSRALLEKSEGWPVTIQLLRQAIASGGKQDQLLDSYSGTSTHLAEYLSEQILFQCQPQEQQFLLKTSILERVNASLAQALSGIEGGFDSLLQSSGLATLLVPLDEHKLHYRYHHMFADFLRAQLQRRYPDQVAPLHMAASEWFKADNNLFEAVRHASLAKSYDSAAELIENAGGWELILYGGIGFLRRLLKLVPDHELKEHPRLQIARAYLCQKEGDISLAGSYLEQARVNPKLNEIRFQAKRQAFERDLAMVEVLQSNYEDDFSISAKHLGLRHSRSEDSIFNGVLNCSMSLFMMAEAKFDEGIEYVQQGVRSMRQADSILGTNYCYLHLGVLSFYQGKLRQAEAYFQEAQSMADENFGSDSGLKYLADLLIFSLRDWRGESSDALIEFNNALDHIENYDGWYEIYIAAYEVLLIRAVQDENIELIDQLCNRCQRVVDERVNPRLAIFVDCCRLYRALINDDELQGQRLLYQYQSLLNGKQPSAWRPLQYLGAAAAKWFIVKQDYNSAEQCLQTLEDNCRTVAAPCFLVNALVLRAELEFVRKQLPRAARYLFNAAEIAWPENIMRPFIRSEHAIAMITAADGVSREQTVDRLSLNFLQQCSAMAKKLRKRSLGQQDILSHREMEVLLKLQGGLSNKEIARALEMTEHTVKFHLKNIFVKLGVDKRAKAVITAQVLGLLER